MAAAEKVGAFVVDGFKVGISACAYIPHVSFRLIRPPLGKLAASSSKSDSQILHDQLHFHSILHTLAKLVSLKQVIF